MSKHALNRRNLCIGIAILCALGFAVLMIPVSDEAKVVSSMSANLKPAPAVDLSGYDAAAPKQRLDLLFIHHSCGGQLLADPGANDGASCIYRSHPNGGGLRARLEQNSYAVHEASYHSRVGHNTDIFDWLPKFRNDMGAILACDSQDTAYAGGRRNRIVVFKSCFPNNDFKAEGAAPGSATGPALTLWNAKAAYQPLLEEFRKHPEVLFVCVTAPPLAPKQPPQPLWKRLAKKALGRGNSLDTSAPLARQFSRWLTAKDGWLKDGAPANVVVFDYYDILTGEGMSVLSRYPTGDGSDSHPSQEGNRRAAEAFVPFLNRAVNRAGLGL